MDIFAKFNEMVDLEGIQEDIAEVENNDQRYEDVPHGKYEVRVEKIDVTATKTEPSRPMMTTWFRILEGEYKNQMIFDNQVMISATGENAGKLTHICNEKLRSLKSDIPVEFKDYIQYRELAAEIAQDIEGRKEYILNYTTNDKGYDQFIIEEDFDV